MGKLSRNIACLAAALVALAGPAGAVVNAGDPSPAPAAVHAIAARAAGHDIDALKHDVVELFGLAQAHINEVGLAQAVTDFADAPWKRGANGLHLWGVNLAGMSWFDAGHPDLVGLLVKGMTDLEGRSWWQLAVDSAQGTGAPMFMILYPHPQTMRAARGFHQCFLLEDGQRVLCAGAFEDPA